MDWIKLSDFRKDSHLMVVLHSENGKSILGNRTGTKTVYRDLQVGLIINMINMEPVYSLVANTSVQQPTNLMLLDNVIKWGLERPEIACSHKRVPITSRILYISSVNMKLYPLDLISFDFVNSAVDHELYLHCPLRINATEWIKSMVAVMPNKLQIKHVLEWLFSSRMDMLVDYSENLIKIIPAFN
jgi:hypothetical protein